MNEWMDGSACYMCKGVKYCWNILLMSRFKQYQVQAQPYIIVVRCKRVGDGSSLVTFSD